MLLGWAREGVEECDSIVKGFLRTDPYEHFSEVDPESGKNAQKIRFLEAPKHLRKVVAHAVSDLKHALDQAAFASCSMLLKAPPDTAYFPFSSHPNDLRSKLIRGPYPDAIHPMYELLEPYPRGDGYTTGSDEFCALSKLANNSKHVVALSARPRAQLTQLKGTSRSGIFIPDQPKWNSDKDELTFMLVAPGVPEIEFNLKVASYVSFSDVSLLENETVGQVFQYWLERVSHAIDGLELATGAILEGATMEVGAWRDGEWVREV